MTGRHRPSTTPPKSVDAFDEDTGALETFEHRLPLVAHSTTGYGSAGRLASPSRRVGVVPAPMLADHRAARGPVDWVTLIRRLLMVVSAVVTLYGVWLLGRADSADGLELGAKVVSGGWVTLAFLAGWGFTRG